MSCFFVHATTLGPHIAALDPALIPELHAQATGHIARTKQADLTYTQLVRIAAQSGDFAVPEMADVLQMYTSLLEEHGLTTGDQPPVRSRGRACDVPRLLRTRLLRVPASRVSRVPLLCAGFASSVGPE